MRVAAHIAGALLGLLFLFAGGTYLLGMVPDMPPPPEGSPMAMFFGAFASTGYLTFVKVLEVIGGVLVAIPRTRNAGLLVLGPIVVNIVAFHVFVTGGEGLLEPMFLVTCVLAAFVLWCQRADWLRLITGERV
ncbi:MAG: hypothetical protein KDC98_14205 [Planctomycetes bacterium]|nr:hypothetical protein [Planctomycetota bacterium]